MYTVIFHREKGSKEYDQSPSHLKFKYCESLKQVREYIHLESFNQKLLSSNDSYFKNRSYYYGDYGFLVMKDGVLVSNSYSFTDGFDCFDYDLPHVIQDVEEVMKMNELIDETENSSMNWFKNFNELKREFIIIEEKHYANAQKEHKEFLKAKEKENKEKELLKELIAKYPDVR